MGVSCIVLHILPASRTLVYDGADAGIIRLTVGRDSLHLGIPYLLYQRAAESAVKKLAEKYDFIVSCGILIGGLLVNQLLYQFVSSFLPGAAGKLFDYLVIYTLGYALISWAGMLWEKEEKRERIILLIIAAAAFVLSVIVHGFQPFSEFKYPPQLYYISYGLLVTFGLYLVLEKISVPENVRQNITWLSVNTMRIYMWHIFLYYLLDTLAPSFMVNALPTYAILLGGSILAAWIQGKLFSFIKKR